jgi:RimJ/RimL family protein N-acetyltransferase
MLIDTRRLRIRPVVADDTPAIAKVIFSDPNVVGMLAHNTRDPADAYREAERWTKVMGADGDGGIWDDGGLGLFAMVPKGADERLAGIAGFYMERNANGRWNGEYFYGLGTDWHGKGLMSEVADAFGEILRSLPDLGVIYAGYWDMINEASGRILFRTGLKPQGRISVTKEYSIEKCQRMFEYDLWRLTETVSEDERMKVLLQATRRAGAFVAENVIGRDDALQKLAAHCGHKSLPPLAISMFERALELPGMAYSEIRSKDEAGTPVNRLG